MSGAIAPSPHAAGQRADDRFENSEAPSEPDEAGRGIRFVSNFI